MRSVLLAVFILFAPAASHAAVDDNWSEAIRKSTVEQTPGSKAEYNLRVAPVSTNGLPTSSYNPLQVETSGDRDIFGAQVVGSKADSIRVSFVRNNPHEVADVETCGDGDVDRVESQLVVSSGADANGCARITSRQRVAYNNGHESGVIFTAKFSGPSSGVVQRAGFYDESNGFALGYNGTSFGVWKITGGAETFEAHASVTFDPLDGTNASAFRRNGEPEAIDHTKVNIYRIRFGWLGDAPVLFEVLSPDRRWVVFHEFKFPNSLDVPSVNDPDLPIRMEVVKTSAGSAVYALKSSSWEGYSVLGAAAEGRASDANSTTELLGAGGIFTGKVERVRQYPNISIGVLTDVSSAQDGLVLQGSHDGVIYFDLDTYTINRTALDFTQISIGRTGFDFFRVKYTNGVTPQGVFSLKVIYDVNRTKPSSHQIDDPISGQNDAELVKAVLTGVTPDGTFVNIPSPGIVEAFSTTTTLSGGATFAPSLCRLTDGWQWGTLTVSSDVASAAGGVRIQFFHDTNCATPVTTSPYSFTYDTPNVRRTFGTQLVGESFKVSYVNGASAQSSFRLHTQLDVVPMSGDVTSIGTPVTTETSATTVKSILSGLIEATGIFDFVRLSPSKSLQVAVTDRPSEVRGRTHVEIAVENKALVVGGTALYTVPVGKTLYIQSVLISGVNQINAIGRLAIRDGTTTHKVGVMFPEKSIGASSGAAVSSPSLPEPLTFSTSVRAYALSGSINASISLIGYVE